MKCIEDEIPFEVPEGWEWCRLQTITSVLTDGTHKTPIYSDEGFVFLSSKNVTSGRIDWENIMYIPESLHEELYSRLSPQVDDILLAKNGTTGVAAIVDRNCVFDIYVSLGLIRIANKIILPKYVLYAIGSTFVQDYFKGSLKGIGVPNLHLEHIRKTLIPIPAENEQTHIVNKIEEILPYAEDVNNLVDELKSSVDAAKSKILDLAIRGKLIPQDSDDEPAYVLLERIRDEKEALIKQGKIKRDKKESIIYRGDDNSYYEKKSEGNPFNISAEVPFRIPDSWSYARLSSLFELLSGRDLTTSEYNDEANGIPYITGASNFNKGEVILNRWTSVPQVITHTGDLLITCKGTVGELSINSFGDAHIARQVMAIRNPFMLDIGYIKLCIAYYVELLKHKSKGLIPGISRGDILNLLIPIPPMSEQHRIVCSFDTFTDTLSVIEASLA